MKILPHAPVVLLALLFGCRATDDAPDRALSPLEATTEFVSSEINGPRALETAVRIDEDWWWRWPGTPHFERTIDHLITELDRAGYVREADAADGESLRYRVEEYELSRPAWEPIRATLTIVGDNEPLLELDTNRNMIAIGSASTSPGGVEALLVDVGAGRRSDFEGKDVEGAIVLGRTGAGSLYRQAVRNGALGALSYRIPEYNRVERHLDSIPFTRIGRRDEAGGFAVHLSTRALRRLESALANGPVRVHVDIETREHTGRERVVVAEAIGDTHGDERIVFSAHVQEPGANDNASGVAVQLEMARALARSVEVQGAPARTITLIWGDEIRAPARYLKQDEDRADKVRFGMSLDMVGADPEKTGGVFLVEKMPDPSAVWTRGNDKHTEWGGRPLRVDQVEPHFFNDFVISRCKDVAASKDWSFDANPYEGGSDHVPFLHNDIPAVLLWHFTDEYYHTDGDRVRNLSADVMANAATVALSSGLILASADADVASAILDELVAESKSRLARELALSKAAIADGNELENEREIIQTWIQWFDESFDTIAEVEPGGVSEWTSARIAEAKAWLALEAPAMLTSIETADGE